MTLIEIMIVMILVGGLLAVLTKTFSGQYEKGRQNTAKIQLAEISKQLNMYYTDCGAFPSSEQGLEALVSAPGSEPKCESWGPDPYMKKLPKDPWGKDFIYEEKDGSFVVRTLGRDKKEGGDGYNKDLSTEEEEK